MSSISLSQRSENAGKPRSADSDETGMIYEDIFRSTLDRTSVNGSDGSGYEEEIREGAISKNERGCPNIYLFPPNDNPSEISRSPSSPTSKLKQMVIKLLPPCQLKHKLQKSDRESKKRRNDSHKKASSFTEIRPDFVARPTTSSGSLRSIVNSFSINFDARATDSSMSTDTSVSISNNTDSTFVDSVTYGDKEDEDSFDSTVLQDHSWFDDRNREDRNAVEDLILGARRSIETVIDESLSKMEGDVGNSIDKVFTEQMAVLRNIVGDCMDRLEEEMKSVLGRKEALLVNVCDTYQAKMEEGIISQGRIEKVYDSMLMSANDKIVEQIEKIHQLQRILANCEAKVVTRDTKE